MAGYPDLSLSHATETMKTRLVSYGGHNADDYGGHPAPTGPALTNLINAVST